MAQESTLVAQESTLVPQESTLAAKESFLLSREAAIAGPRGGSPPAAAVQFTPPGASPPGHILLLTELI